MSIAKLEDSISQQQRRKGSTANRPQHSMHEAQDDLDVTRGRNTASTLTSTPSSSDSSNFRGRGEESKTTGIKKILKSLKKGKKGKKMNNLGDVALRNYKLEQKGSGDCYPRVLAF
uniref:Uncharacterized protein n=1 Tax=Leptocylindrus danicus TaxID=163516 RepID=A0A7S2JQC5_9STRA|mmetsp:Transcript_10332/g.15516  ORF Transcript_10332/g.15516 Transcript_10332/m.15516 type:complete len:116 (+) Transcript_10332:314-661(+)